MVGGGGAQVYKFAAESEGTSKIILNYKRSWEEDSVSQAQITVDVV
jgi:predicted secreted protein